MSKIWEAEYILCRNSCSHSCGCISACSSQITPAQHTAKGSACIKLPEQQLCFLPGVLSSTQQGLMAFFFVFLCLFGGFCWPLITMQWIRVPGINIWKNILQASPQKFGPPDAVGHKHTRYKYAKTVLSLSLHHQSVFLGCVVLSE